MFSARLPLRSLLELCRVLRQYLDAGLSLVDVFRQLSRKAKAPLRPVAERIHAGLARGESLEAMLGQEERHFPPLLISLAIVGEQSGTLPDVFRTLEEYFRMQQQLIAEIRTRSLWPLFQFGAAIFVIAGMLYLLGVLAPPGATPVDPIGLGTGASGALLWLVCVFGSLAGLVVTYLVVKKLVKETPWFDRFLLKVPVLGPFFQALALARLCLGLRLTLDSSMSNSQALTLSLRATGNAAFSSRSGSVTQALKKGQPITQALRKVGLIPSELLEVMSVGEVSGQLPETMAKQAELYREETQHRLAAVSRLVSVLIWLVVAALIITLIFRIMTTSILPAYNV